MDLSKYDEKEIARVEKKFEISRDDPLFKTAFLLDKNRPDRTVNELPDVMCPHCSEEFTATYEDVRHGSEMPCPGCENIIHIEHIDLPDGPDDDGFPQGEVWVTLRTRRLEES